MTLIDYLKINKTIIKFKIIKYNNKTIIKFKKLLTIIKYNNKTIIKYNNKIIK